VTASLSVPLQMHWARGGFPVGSSPNVPKRTIVLESVVNWMYTWAAIQKHRGQMAWNS
jgi:hypothetical protein